MTLCECGCGQETKIYRGKPNRFVQHHHLYNNHHNTGKKMSCIAKDRMSKAHKGRKCHTHEFKIKLSERSKGNQYGLGYRHTEEVKRKLSETNRGENSPNWQGGISFEPYCPKFNEQFKESIREKFGRKCFLCSKDENDNNCKKLSVHHVQYNKNCGCDDSLKCDYVPLCMSCHMKTNHNRDYYERSIIEKLEELIL